MAPKLNGVDHVHVNVSSWDQAEAWYARILGFKRVEALTAWAVKNGPLTIEDEEGHIHLALFETDDNPEPSSVAFGTTGEGFLAWKTRLEANGLKLRVADHQLAYSLYFSDPWGNHHEITTYDRDYVAKRLS